MNSLYSWLAGKLAPYIYIDKFSIIKPDQMLIINVPESMPDREIEQLTVNLKKVMPRDNFIVIATDKPINITRFQ